MPPTWLQPNLRNWKNSCGAGTKIGSAVSIAIEQDSAGQPKEFCKNDLKNRHQLRKPLGNKVTQGLYYASHGMDENNSTRRWYREAGERWTLTLTARRSFQKNGKSFPSEEVLKQAEASLWLLSRYGGVGSKSRKGFGSLRDIEIQSIGSIDDCIGVGIGFRELCGISSSNGTRTGTSALEQIIGPVDVKTKWTNTWQALDQVGEVYQLVTYRRTKEQRAWVGLPRRLGDQDWKVNGRNRHASPLHWHLAKSENGSINIRLVAFPSSQLPDFKESKSFLETFVEDAKISLEEAAKELAPRSSKGIPPMGQEPSTDSDLPKKGSLVRAVLLEKRTRKLKWKARQVDGKMIAEIFNHTEVPASHNAGDEVELRVSISKIRNGRFEWPTEKPSDGSNSRNRKESRPHRNRRKKHK